ncbi:AI-2E family transporter [Oscillatoria sp. CS-180]|uniref:AI-2E family transporter n=1 Tax=Oscillatoria sp. CS-180 TaxID=3021720 RepID=UPI0023304DAA|nr:AI-2E family transporter [Oscillatoria sp. CS-180]MDB9527256.1 AI-2E family transporter [Oscillatoria sp. CS-180]
MTQTSELQEQSWITRWWQSLGAFARTLMLLLAAPLLILNVWAIAQIFDYFHEILVSVIVASLLAFLLSYPTGWLKRLGVKQGVSSILVLLSAVVILITLGITILPLVVEQAEQLVTKLPEWFDSGKGQLLTLDGRFENWGLPFNLDGLIAQVNDRLKVRFEQIAGEALNLTFGVAIFTANKLLDVVLTVVLTFYLLQHGDEVWDGIVGWLPDRIQQLFSETLRLSFRNYFLGQFIVASLMGIILTVVYLFLQVPFGLLFGSTVGLAALIPFGGTVSIVIVTLLVALRDISVAVKMLIASVLVQQLVENVIAPRVLGSFTGLNPFWVFIALLSGARVGGLLGIIVAVPVAVVVKEALEAIRVARHANAEDVLSAMADESDDDRNLFGIKTPSLAAAIKEE